MKKILTLTALLFCLTAFGQAKPEIKIDNYYELMVINDFKKVAYIKKDSSLVVIDSLATINQLLASIKSMQEQINVLHAAKNVLDHVSTQGFVLNKNMLKFNKATREYFKVTKRKDKYDKMQPMHILTMDKNGTLTGFIKQ